MPGHLINHMPPWKLKELEPFQDAFLSGHVTERYAVSLSDGFREAKSVMEDQITGMINRDIGGDHQIIDWRKTRYVGVTFKHTLLPIWVANYRYREKLFQVLVNGRSGRVAGDRPWSWWKITRLVLLIIFAILLVVILVNMAKGRSKHATAPSREYAWVQPNWNTAKTDGLSELPAVTNVAGIPTGAHGRMIGLCGPAADSSGQARWDAPSRSDQLAPDSVRDGRRMIAVP